MKQKIVEREIKENEVIQLREEFENKTVMMCCAPFFPYNRSLKNQDKK